MADQLPNFTSESLVRLCVYASNVTEGEDRENVTVFHAHLKVLTKASPIFKTALEGPWTEGESKTYEFKAEDKVDPATVNRFLQWAYTGKTNIDENNSKDAHYMERFQLYIFADKYRVVDLMNSMVDILCKKTPTSRSRGRSVLPTPEMIELVYENTSDGSPLRQIILSIFLYHGNARDYFLDTPGGEILDTLPEFTLDIAKTLLEESSIDSDNCKHCSDQKSLLVTEDDRLTQGYLD